MSSRSESLPQVPGEEPSPLKSHFLFPGNLFAAAEPHLVTTVLGSCVSVCLCDPRKQVGGINHFLLPLWNGEGLPTPRYGNIAIEALIEKMANLGCGKSGLKAKVFGGSAMWANPNGLISVGDRNVSLTLNLLKTHGIPVIGADVGGESGRKLFFNTGTGEVWLRRHRGLSP